MNKFGIQYSGKTLETFLKQNSHINSIVGQYRVIFKIHLESFNKAILREI